MKLETLPDEVGPNEDGTRLRIRWRDGAESSYAPRSLRLAMNQHECLSDLLVAQRSQPAAIRVQNRFDPFPDQRLVTQ